MKMDASHVATKTGARALRFHPARVRFAVLNVLGGAAVLGSYAHGLLTNPTTRNGLWGEVPADLMSFYTLNMFLAAFGYFFFTAFVLFKLDPDRVRVGERFGFGLFSFLYALILIPSALWMPLTLQMLESPSALLWLGIRVDLALVGIGSIGLIWALARVRPHEAPIARRLALIGSVPFALQTAVLDATVWPAFFPF
jgi:hypothetical protein